MMVAERVVNVVVPTDQDLLEFVGAMREAVRVGLSLDGILEICSLEIALFFAKRGHTIENTFARKTSAVCHPLLFRKRVL
jgi:hypothetical protein